MNSKKIKFTISSSFENVELVGMSINKICSTHFGSTDVSSQIELCVVEACNNVIEHAYSNNPDNEFSVDLLLTATQIEITITDTGVEKINHTSPNLEFDPNDLENLPEGGMGLFIIEQIMCQIDYYRIDGKNIFKMAKQIDKK